MRMLTFCHLPCKTIKELYYYCMSSRIPCLGLTHSTSGILMIPCWSLRHFRNWRWVREAEVATSIYLKLPNQQCFLMFQQMRSATQKKKNGCRPRWSFKIKSTQVKSYQIGFSSYGPSDCISLDAFVQHPFWAVRVQKCYHLQVLDKCMQSMKNDNVFWLAINNK